MNKKFLPTIMIITAAVFWGTAGLFTNWLADYGFSSTQIASFRMISAAVTTVIIALIKGKKLFKIKLSSLPILLAIGVISIFATSFFYLGAITASSMATAAILMYTAPFIVVIASVFLYKEKLTIKKVIALIVAFIGCILVSGTGSAGAKGIIFGLISGVTYASYSLFSKKALQSVESFTISLYGFIFAAVSSLFTVNIPGTVAQLKAADLKCVLLIAGIGVITSVLPYLFYTYGLKYTEAGNASIISMTEPLVATVFGFTVFGQKPTLSAITGIILIVLAVIIIEMRGKEHGHTKSFCRG